MKTPKIFFECIAFFLLSYFSQAQGIKTITFEQSDGWQFIIEPYLMFPNMDGTSGIGLLPDTEVKSSARDIFNNLEIGSMLNAEASKGKWHINSDVIYMNLEQKIEEGIILVKGKINVKQFAWSMAGLYRLTPWLDLGVGGTYNSMKLASSIEYKNLEGTTSKSSRKGSQSWFDPMLIARTHNQPGTKILYEFRGDIGGFGIGSDLAWQIQAYAGYRFSKLFQITAGYRWIGVDYEKTNTAEAIIDNNRFLYDMTTSGIVIRAGFNF